MALIVQRLQMDQGGIPTSQESVLIDTRGALLHAIVYPSDLQHRDGGIMIVFIMFGQFPFRGRPMTGTAYARLISCIGFANILRRLKTESFKHPHRANDFEVHPKPWLVESIESRSRLTHDFNRKVRNMSPVMH
jgi:hypothetical protein